MVRSDEKKYIFFYCKVIKTSKSAFISTLHTGFLRNCIKSWLYLLFVYTYHKAKPKPQYGSKHKAICRLGYNSQANFIDRHSEVTAACDIFIPANIPVVETLKSKYANISAVGALYNIGNFFFGISSVSNITGHDLISQTLLASFDLNSFITAWDDKIITDLLTSTIILTVGRVV